MGPRGRCPLPHVEEVGGCRAGPRDPCQAAASVGTKPSTFKDTKSDASWPCSFPAGSGPGQRGLSRDLDVCGSDMASPRSGKGSTAAAVPLPLEGHTSPQASLSQMTTCQVLLRSGLSRGRARSHEAPTRTCTTAPTLNTVHVGWLGRLSKVPAWFRPRRTNPHTMEPGPVAQL